MRIRWLRTFRAVVDEGSFEKAARVMNCTQSTVSFQIRKLEERLGTALFDRVGRGAQLNDAGRRCLKEVDAVLGASDRLLAAGKKRSALTGTLRMAVPESLLNFRLQPVFSRFRELAPEVRLSAEPLNCYEIGGRLARGVYDLAVYYDTGDLGDVIETTPLARYPIGLFASSALDLKDIDFVHPGSENPVTLLTNDRKSYLTIALHRYLARQKIRIAGTMEISSIEAVRRGVIGNLGVAAMFRHVFEEELARGEVREIALASDPRRITVIFARNRNRARTAPAALFERLTLEHFRNLGPRG